MKNMKVSVLSVIGVLLLCSVASAIEVTPYFKISREYASNPFRVRKEWTRKEICIEGQIVLMNINDNGNALVVLSDGNDGRDPGATHDHVAYIFFFDGVPDEVMSLEKDQWVKLSGKLLDIKPEKELFVIRVDSAKVLE